MVSRLARFGVPLLVSALIAVSAPNQILPQGGGYLFRLKLFKGLKLSYAVAYSVSSPSLPGGKVNVTAPLLLEVLKLENGVATASETMGPVVMNGQKQPSRTATVEMNALGKIITGDQPGMQGITLTLPEKPLKVGGSWAASIPLSVDPGAAGSAAVRYKLVGIKQQGGRKVATLDIAVTGGASGGGTALISMADGFLIKTEMTIKMTVPGAKGPIPVTAVASVVRR